MNKIINDIEITTGFENISTDKVFDTYITEQIHPITEIKESLKKGLETNEMPIVNGYRMKTSERYKLFSRDELVCVHCGQKASFWASQKFRRDKGKKTHLNLYGINKSGETIMLTKDHIVPKSHGGTDEVENYQIMCSKCNLEKGNTPEEDLNDYEIVVDFKDTFLNDKSAITNLRMVLEIRTVSEKGAKIIAKGLIKKRFKGAKINSVKAL